MITDCCSVWGCVSRPLPATTTPAYHRSMNPRDDPSTPLAERIKASEGIARLVDDAEKVWQARGHEPRNDWNQFLDTIGPQWTNFINRVS